MEDFEEKLNSILSSPETMSQIMSIASSLTGQERTSGTEAEAPAQQEDTAEPSPLSLLSSLDFSAIDPTLIGRILPLLQEFNRSGDEKAALLQAMRPFLTEERRPKLDKAVQITRIARVLRSALREFGRDGLV